MRPTSAETPANRLPDIASSRPWPWSVRGKRKYFPWPLRRRPPLRHRARPRPPSIFRGRPAAGPGKVFRPSRTGLTNRTVSSAVQARRSFFRETAPADQLVQESADHPAVDHVVIAGLRRRPAGTRRRLRLPVDKETHAQSRGECWPQT